MQKYLKKLISLALFSLILLNFNISLTSHSCIPFNSIVTLQNAFADPKSTAITLSTVVYGDITSKEADRGAIAKLNKGLKGKSAPKVKGHITKHRKDYRKAGAKVIDTNRGAMVIDPSFINKEEDRNQYSYYRGNIEHSSQESFYTNDRDNVLLRLTLHPPAATPISNIKEIVQPLHKGEYEGTAATLVAAADYRILLTAEHVIKEMGVDKGDTLTLFSGVRLPALLKKVPENYSKYEIDSLYAKITRIEKDPSSDLGIIFVRVLNDKIALAQFGDILQVSSIARMNPGIGDELEFYSKPLFDLDRVKIQEERIGKMAVILGSDEYTGNNRFFKVKGMRVIEGQSGSPIGKQMFNLNFIAGILSHKEPPIWTRIHGENTFSYFVKPRIIEDFIKKVSSDK